MSEEISMLRYKINELKEKKNLFIFSKSTKVHIKASIETSWGESFYEYEFDLSPEETYGLYDNKMNILLGNFARTKESLERLLKEKVDIDI